MTNAFPRPPVLRIFALALTALAGGACSVDKNSVLAPSDAVISMVAASPLATINGSTTVTVQVTDADGSPVADGTEILVGATRGEFDSPKVRTRGGTATVTYNAPPDPGAVELHAASDDVSGAMQLAIASAPVARITLSASPALLPYGGGQVELRATAFSQSGERVVSAPVTFHPSTGSVSPGTATLTNEQGQVTVKLSATKAADVRAKVHLVESATLRIEMEDNLGLTIDANPSQPIVGQSVTFTITPSDLKREGSMSIVYGDGQRQQLGDGAGIRTVAYSYSTAGAYTVRVTFVSKFGTQVQKTAQVTVNAGITPVPSPSGGGSGGDGNLPFSLSEVTWLHADVSNWAITSNLPDVEFGMRSGGVGTICLPHSKAGRWPSRDGGEGNPWIIAKIGGRWYAGTWEWLKTGQTCKSGDGSFVWDDSVDGIGPHVGRSPMSSWSPRSGELVGFLVSAFARDSTRTVLERSNIVMTTWP